MRKSRNFANVCIKNLAKLTTDFIFDKFDRDQTNHLFGRRYGARRPRDKLEVVRHSASSKLFFLGMAAVCVAAIFFMVTDIQVG